MDEIVKEVAQKAEVSEEVARKLSRWLWNS